MGITFEAEIKQISATKTVSNDKEIKLVLITDNPKVLDLQHLIASDTVKVTVE
jgi:hypothetical protein